MLAFCTVNHSMPSLVEDQRVRIARCRIRQLVLGDVAGLRIELADQPREVAGEPDVAVLVLDQAVRAGMRRLERDIP